MEPSSPNSGPWSGWDWEDPSHFTALEQTLRHVSGQWFLATKRVHFESSHVCDTWFESLNSYEAMNWLLAHDHAPPDFLLLQLSQSNTAEPTQPPAANDTCKPTVDAVDCHVTLLQMAAMVNKSKRTLESLRRKGRLPAPAVKGGKGKANEWQWSVVRPILQEEYGRQLPDEFPADRFVRR